jgi:septal ring factor EnvC (AmiA/AmiB activator)
MQKLAPRGIFITCTARVVCTIILCAAESLTAQDNQQAQLEQIRQRIARLQQEVAAQEKSESSALEFLRTMDEQIDLTSRLVGQMKREEKKNQQRIAALEKSLQKTDGELQRLRELAGRRMVYFYKYGRMREIELLLSTRSASQILHWAEFQQRLSDNDRRIVAGIAAKKESTARQRGLIAAELEKQQRILAEKQSEEAALKQRRQQRQEVLKKVRKDKAYYKMQLAESQKAAERIKELIASAATREAESAAPFTSNVDFARLRGSLPWPIEGRIVSQYGTYRHPVLKTETERLGIDIAAAPGSEVRSVAAGKVTAITWQRGHGNLLIVSHASGYFTIYTHLAEILVAPNEVVEAGQALGTIGDNGSEGAILHFEIWQRVQHMNPEEWLR